MHVPHSKMLWLVYDTPSQEPSGFVPRTRTSFGLRPNEAWARSREVRRFTMGSGFVTWRGRLLDDKGSRSYSTRSNGGDGSSFYRNRVLFPCYESSKMSTIVNVIEWTSNKTALREVLVSELQHDP